jgi:hypothetical protein
MDIHATPAYGRDYKSKAAVLKDWTEGKDFQCALTGKYLSVRDEIPNQVWIRYNKLRNIVRVQ